MFLLRLTFGLSPSTGRERRELNATDKRGEAVEQAPLVVGMGKLKERNEVPFVHICVVYSVLPVNLVYRV
jgi:hypothetical protein